MIRRDSKQRLFPCSLLCASFLFPVSAYHSSVSTYNVAGWTYNNVASRVHRGNKEDIEHEKSDGQVEVNIQEGALIQDTPAYKRIQWNPLIKGHSEPPNNGHSFHFFILHVKNPIAKKLPPGIYSTHFKTDPLRDSPFDQGDHNRKWCAHFFKIHPLFL